MPVVERQALVPYSPEKMFALVNNVNNYPEFLPWCDSCDILSQSDVEMKATIHIQKSGIKQSFTTQNTLEQNKSITLTLVDGPFQNLHGKWTFTPMGHGSEVSLYLEFEFSSKIATYGFGPIFNQATSTMLKSFINQARAIYGK